MKTIFKKDLAVLVIEDNKIDAKIVRSMLEKTSYGKFHVSFVMTIKEAIELLLTQKFDVCLLDLNLKDSKGLDSLKKINKKYAHLPIVVNTGAYQDSLGLKAVTQGAQDYLIKGKYKPYALSKSLYYAVQRKKAELELQIAYNRLKETQSQLIQAEKLSCVGGVASGVAHEVKNPLATILYGVEYLNMKLDKEDEKTVLTLNSIKDAAKKANEIIKELLDFASISHFHQQAEDVNEIIQHSLNFTKHQCESNNIKVDAELTDKLAQVKVDKNRIEQVIVDVLLNAIYAMPDGGGLTVKTWAETFSASLKSKIGDSANFFKAGDEVVCISIEDTGKGIKKEDLNQIFDPFFTTRRAAGGVGLGLSIAKTIMTSHKGGIMLENVRGKGARATLMFKVKRKG
ncbi:MAG: response regulator [Candidatus Omnitrophica bacterium]|nr:response regulator [Candidatus Omnitrophota bacterium]